VKAWGTREEDEWRVKNRFYMNRERKTFLHEWIDNDSSKMSFKEGKKNHR
jgi:hypothetical protein